MGVFKTIYNQSPGPCRIIQVNGSEDIVLLSSGEALISSGFRDVKPSDVVSNVPLRDGNIYLFNFNDPEANIRKLNILTSNSFNRSSFNPHGISSWQNEYRTLLYVVNHLSDGEAIEIFEYLPKDGALKHIQQVQHHLINSPNDVEAIGSDMFYVTNDHYFNSPLMRKMETYLQFAISTVAFHDESKNETRLVAWSLPYPNGIHLSLDQRYLYVVASNGPDMVIYERNSDHTLDHIQTIRLPDTCDNMFVEPITGYIWLGCHPRLIDTAEYSERNCSHKAGSQVLRLRLGTKTTGDDGRPVLDYDIDQVFINDGSLLKGSSVAVYYHGKMLVGSPLDKLLYCEVKSFDGFE
ncbi:serum paraoxonase/arylesterase 1-like isoform X2 [Corticium candelabrum]|nr:serum paraoxonase/arylesterase 1-like isoform X2 [Corticium candelabrum]XP_062503520.1 serum paraoxonase/arylesterase 1-like isoform X2 [Corticium candelabrum]